jgi:multicomponent Na+:H+ antiporter subunit A
VYDVGDVRLEDLPIVALLMLAVAAGVTAARDPGRLRPVLALSVLGFALAAVYAVVGAPDVALVAVVVETALTLVFVGVYSRLPPIPAGRTAARHGQRGIGTAQRHIRRDRRRRGVRGDLGGVVADQRRRR